jgi:tetrathionate reductase subunit A
MTDLDHTVTAAATGSPDERDVDDDWQLSRRTFLKTSALVGGGVAIGSQAPALLRSVGGASAVATDGSAFGPDFEYHLADPAHIIHSACLQCNTGCPIKVKVVNGVVSKIDGNPYSPNTFWPYLDYETSPLETGGIDGWICPKGQTGIQSTYDPYRIRQVLKRVGPRGGDQWESIPLEQAITEIVDGATFADGSTAPGLREIWALRDVDLGTAMAKAVEGITAEKDADARQELVTAFQQEFADDLDVLIDPEHPDFGPKNNQLCFAWGRLKDGRGELIKRFTGDSFGSVNAHGHTTVCQGSLYFTGKAMSEQFVEGKWSGGEKFYWQGDFVHTEFAILVGSNVFEGGYGPPYRVEKITEGLSSGRLKYVVIDPRQGKTGSKAWKWLPNIPGTEAAIALALIQAILRDERHNAAYLVNANKAAADAAGEPNFCNASWLVKLDDDGVPGKLLRGSDLGLEPEEREKADGSGIWSFDPFIVWDGSGPVPFDPNDTEVAVTGELLVDRTINGIAVKSGLQLLADSANEHTIDEWADIAGVSASALEEIAREFTRHGRRACADIHRGVSQHTNGYYNVQCWNDLNLLIGNYDYAGGMSVAKAYDSNGGKEGQPYPVTKMIDVSLPRFGHTLIRSGKYETSTLFDGYPAQRPWYPLATDIYQEIVPSIGDAYPYPMQALILYMGSPVYALPAGHTNIEVLKDPSKLPLFVAIDIVVGETSAYADYIVPDLTYLERWEFHKPHPNMVVKSATVRQPTIAPLTDTATVFGIEQPISLETFILAVAERMELPGFGPNGLGEGVPFLRPEDHYLKQVANIAVGDKPDLNDAVPEADDAEVQLFLDARRHLPATVFDVDVWTAAVDGDDATWRRMITVLNRGGRWAPYDKILDGDQLSNKYGKYVGMYCEKTYDVKDSMTGEHLSGVGRYVPAGHDSLGNPVSEQDVANGYDLSLITFRTIMQTKSRTAGNYWARAVEPTNHVVVNPVDARRLGLDDGDRVRVTSATNTEGVWDLGNGRTVPMEGEVKLLEGLRPGVVGFNLGYGHWAYGASDVVIDGERIPGEERRQTGIHANAAMRTDTANPNTTLSDQVGGSAVFYDTKVMLRKV